MQKLRTTEIEILDYIVSICNKCELRYYLLYGTLLGAIRHKGFIPWDDDIDIGLPRKDYDQLCKILERQCNREGSLYFYQSIQVEKGFRLPYSKLRKNGTVFMEEGDEERNIHNGVFVDIFPLDKTKKVQGLQKPFSYVIYRLYKYAGKWDVDLFLKIAAKVEKFYENKDCKYYVSYGSPYPVEKDVVKIEWFDGEEFSNFEGKKYRIPKEYDAYLRQLYGDDYMQLPPISDRKTHSPVMLKFEDT